MASIEDAPGLKDLLEPGGPKDAGYDEWLKETVARAIARDRAHPELRVTGDEMRARLQRRIRENAEKP